MVIDAGHTLLPGLWDMHTHISRTHGLLHLAGGVTTVRDLANDTDELIETKKLYDTDAVLGPRIILAGFMDGSGKYTGPTKVVVDTEEQAVAAMNRYVELGYEQIKLYSSIKPELVDPIAKAAHARGLRVSGHIPAFMTAEQAVRAGYDEIQHINMLVLNFLFDKVQDTRTPARFSAIAGPRRPHPAHQRCSPDRAHDQRRRGLPAGRAVPGDGRAPRCREPRRVKGLRLESG